MERQPLPSLRVDPFKGNQINKMAPVVPIDRIARGIVLVRGRKVLLDAHLAALYGVSTKRFNEQVRRNAARFPEDFMLRSQSRNGVL